MFRQIKFAWGAVALVWILSFVTVAEGAPFESTGPRDAPVKARLIAEYFCSAWVKPQFVVIDGEQAWNDWNDDAISGGSAVGFEPLPGNVNWGSEIVVLFALGDHPDLAPRLGVKGAHHNGWRTQIDFECDLYQGGPSAALLIALPRGLARQVIVRSNVPIEGVPAEAKHVNPFEMSRMTEAVPALPTSWGAVKAYYR